MSEGSLRRCRAANVRRFPSSAAAFRCRRSRPREWTAASNAPGSDPIGADAEVLLDIEVAVSVAPGAAQVVYFGPNTDQAFVDTISDAAHAAPTPIVVTSAGRSGRFLVGTVPQLH